MYVAAGGLVWWRPAAPYVGLRGHGGACQCHQTHGGCVIAATPTSQAPSRTLDTLAPQLTRAAPPSRPAWRPLQQQQGREPPSTAATRHGMACGTACGMRRPSASLAPLQQLLPVDDVPQPGALPNDDHDAQHARRAQRHWHLGHAQQAAGESGARVKDQHSAFRRAETCCGKPEDALPPTGLRAFSRAAAPPAIRNIRNAQ